MTTRIESRASEPLHQQLRAIILSAIGSGEWPPHSQIASERELCERYGISRTTTRKVLSDLVHEGAVYTISGKGTFVADKRLRQELQPLVGFTQDLRDQGVVIVSQVHAFERIEAEDGMAAKLGIRPGAAVVRLQRTRHAGEQPLALQTTFLPEHLCPGILRHDFSRASLFETLRAEFGLVLREGTTVIKPGLASAEEAARLGLGTPAAVLRTFQTTFLADGQAIEYCETAFHGEAFELTVGTDIERGFAFSPSFAPARAAVA